MRGSDVHGVVHQDGERIMGLPPSEIVPVSAEARGKAREFIRRALAEDDLRLALINGFLRDIGQRKDRHPGRRLSGLRC